MELTVRILFIIGLLVSAIKGADLILRPHQQKWVQDKCDSLALHLEYTKPITWFTENGILQNWFWVFFLLGILLLLGLIRCWCLMPVAILIVWLYRKELDIPKWLEGEFNSTTDSEASLENLLKYLAKQEHALLSWLFDSESYLEYLFRSLMIALIHFGAICLIFAGMYAVAALLEIAKPYLRHVSGLKNYMGRKFGPTVFVLFIAALVCLTVAGFPAVLVTIFMLLLFIAELLLKVMRSIAWRVVEYNKGAYAALVLIITIALGIAEIFLKTPSH
jgi:hypothetical protein